MSRRKTNNLLVFADVLMSFSEMVTGVLGSIERAGYRRQQEYLNALRIQGAVLKNELTSHKVATEAHRTAVTADEIVIRDQKIEKQELEIRLLRERVRLAGLLNDAPGGSNRFIALEYPEPGDVRHGILPPPRYVIASPLLGYISRPRLV